MAVTAEGVPVRCWTFPGNTSDQVIIRTIKDDLAGWMLNRVVWVADRGFNSAANRVYLQKGGGHYIVAEKLRNASGEAKEALSRPGRFHIAAGNLEVKEVIVVTVSVEQRFVVCFNPEAEERDQRSGPTWSPTWRPRSQAPTSGRSRSVTNWPDACAPRRHCGAWCGVLNDGRFRIDKAAIAREEKLDGKWLLRTSDDSLTPTDLALAYKQLLEVERGWRDMKGSLGLRPVFHHREDRIRSHVQLCWLALLLIRVVENATDDTWRNVRHELDRMHLVTMETAEGRVAQRTTTTTRQAEILAKLDIAEPGRSSISSFRRPPRSPWSQTRVVTRLKRQSAPVLPAQYLFLGWSCACYLSNPGQSSAVPKHIGPTPPR